MAEGNDEVDRFAISDSHSKVAARPKLFSETMNSDDISSFILPQRSASTGRTAKKTPRATTSPPNKRRNGFLSSTISSVQRSFNRTIETEALGKIPAFPVLLSSRNTLKSSIIQEDGAPIPIPKPKSPSGSPQKNRLTLSTDSTGGNGESSNLFEISQAIATIKKTPTNCSAKKVVKQEKELRKKAQEVAILMENRLSRLKDIEREYQRKIEEASKQADLIQKNKERHVEELKKKREQHKEKKKEIKEKQEFFSQLQNDMKQKIMESKQKALEEKKRVYMEMKKKKENLMKEAKKMKNSELKRKKENIKRIEMDKLIAKEMRVQDVIKKIQQNVEELSSETEYEKALKLLISEQAVTIEDAEVQMLEKLKKLEEEQKKVVEHLNTVALSSSQNFEQ